MVILGAGGHAKEVLDVLLKLDYSNEIAFFDDVTPDEDFPELLNSYNRLKTEEQLKEWFKNETKSYVLGVGAIPPRAMLRKIGNDCLGVETTLIAKNSELSLQNLDIGAGTVVMQMAFISGDVNIGQGVLINTRASIHHDVSVGDYSEIAPGATILGRVQVGHSTFIGANAVILPKVKIGNNCIIGAGSVVTKDVPDNTTVYGNPAR